MAIGLIVGLVCPILGCQTVSQRELVPPEHVRLMHSDQHCSDVDKAAESPFQDADHVDTAVMGKSVFLGLFGSEWEWTARQLAVERDADLSLIRPCDGEDFFKYAQIEVWRTRGFSPPVVQDETHPESGTLLAPSSTPYGTRLQNIFECLEYAYVTSGPISTENMQRLGTIDAKDYFTSGPYFFGYARIDRYYRPTRTGELSLSGILFDRAKADWAAAMYWELSREEKAHFANRYVSCLLDRGYRWSPV